MRELIDWLFPRPCVACRSAVTGADGRFGLCPRCEAALRPLARAPECERCGERVPAGPLCAPCALAPPPWERLFALWQYEPPARELIHAFKFHRLDYLGLELGRALAERVRDPSASRGLPDLVVPMPLAWPRRLARGFNQAEIVAGALAREIGRPERRLLRRRLAFVHQTGRSRRERLAGAAAGLSSGPFRMTPWAWPRDSPGRPGFEPRRSIAGRHLLLVDDVLTTGATARAAAELLLAAGARRVDLAVAARTPRRRPV